jgi:hypothetical protein
LVEICTCKQGGHRISGDSRASPEPPESLPMTD